MKILFKYATRSRPQKFKEGIMSIISNIDNDNYKILVSVDSDDETMKEPGEYKNTEFIYGTSKNKIDAINRDMDKAGDWDILVVMSDDMKFISRWFDEDIRDAFRTHQAPDKPCDLDQLVHFPDQNQYDNCMTMSIMGRDYYNRFGYIYHPSYDSLWCDLEASDVGKILGKYKYMGNEARIFNHLHPSFGQAEYDEQYRKTEAWEVRTKDHGTYEHRKANNFFISGK
jgi:hypothetical protein